MHLLALWLSVWTASSWAGSLSTTSAGGTSANGAMFAVRATNPLTISSLATYSASTGSCSYNVYYTTSTLSSVLTTSSAWTLLQSATTGVTAGTTFTSSFTPVSVPAGSTVAFYVTFTSCSVRLTTGSSTGSAYTSNSDLTIYEGYARGYSSTFGGSSASPRVWNGTVNYITCTGTTYYADDDGDSYGDASSTISACSRPSGYVNNSRDCDDGDSAIRPGATEYCDGADNDCDSTVDESAAVDASTWYRDADADGYGRSSSTTVACDQPSGYAASSTDCDDTDSSVYPGAPEHCDSEDDDCDGSTDESAVDATTWYQDADGDGYGGATTTSTSCSAPSGYVAVATDCDDGDSAVSPAASERCNSVDDDCDSTVDEASAVDATSWYRDADADGYGTASVTTPACTVPSGYTADATDCDDGDAAEHPGASERCDGDDDDCDSAVDEASAVDAATWYRDADADGYGLSSVTSLGCAAPSGYVADATDCDDGDDAVNPGESERCNGDDDDCDGVTDEDSAVDATVWYADADLDGYGDLASGTASCSAIAGRVLDATDCDDGDDTEHPGAVESCDGDDDDCDGTADEGDAVDALVWYADLDADGYGDATSTVTACDEPAGYGTDATDCDDADGDTWPGAPETPYDGVDQDCDGADLCDDDEDGQDAIECGGTDCDDDDPLAYEGAAEVWYSGLDEACDGGSDYDRDGDGYDNATYGGDDCDDARSNIYPGAVDTPYDGVVTDCDEADEFDQDGDGHDIDSRADGDDCDDANSAINPDVAEVYYDGVDSNCDGHSDYDADGDAWVSDAYGGEDCDDTDVEVYPGARDEPYDGDVTDCDATDEYDQDGDGHDAVGYGLGDDCDDEDDRVHPGAAEEPADGVDDDCDGGDVCFADGDDDGQLDESGDTVVSADLDCDDAGEGDDTTPLTDCNNADAAAFYGAPEVCGDLVDNSCDGRIDENCLAEDPGDTGKVEDPGGCGCASGGGPAAAAGVLAAVAVWARRRRRA